MGVTIFSLDNTENNDIVLNMKTVEGIYDQSIIAIEGIDFEYLPWHQVRVSGGILPSQEELWYPMGLKHN